MTSYEQGNGRHDAAEASGRASAWSNAELLERMRASEERAVKEFYDRLLPGLRLHARRLRVQPALRDEVVADVIRALHATLSRPGRPAPESLPAYATRALERHVRRLEKQTREAPEVLEEALLVAAEAEEADDDEDAPRAGEANEGARRRSGISALAAAVAAALTPDEQDLLVWLADFIPQRVIAEWRGVSYVGMRGRILRLRERAKKLAWRWVAERPPDERARLTRILERAAGPPPPPTMRRQRAPTRNPLRPTVPSPGASDDPAP